MLAKNIEKERRKNRKTWTGYYKRTTPTKAEKLIKLEKRNKQKCYKDLDSSSTFVF